MKRYKEHEVFDLMLSNQNGDWVLAVDAEAEIEKARAEERERIRQLCMNLEQLYPGYDWGKQWTQLGLILGDLPLPNPPDPKPLERVSPASAAFDGDTH